MEVYLKPVEFSQKQSSSEGPRKRRRCSRPECNKYSQGPTTLCVAHGGGKLCAKEGCPKVSKGGGYCIQHGGGKRCEREECSKSAKGPTGFCIAHGGGKRCRIISCQKLVSSGQFCKSHGGGRICEVEECTNCIQGKGRRCKKHGGGAFCAHEACKSKDAGRGFCVKHGGGRRCTFYSENNRCRKSAQGKTSLCFKHGRALSQQKQNEKRSSQASLEKTPVALNDFFLCSRRKCRLRALNGGKCSLHTPSKKCSVTQCKHIEISSGLCEFHAVELIVSNQTSSDRKDGIIVNLLVQLEKNQKSLQERINDIMDKRHKLKLMLSTENC